jgi:alpha-tubulin suppressor-like RCC1 family protein
MRSALSRSLLAVLSVALLMAGGFALPAEASEGTPVPTSDGGTVVAWGGNGYPGTTAALAGKTVTAIAGGGYHDLALTSEGHLTGWGNNMYGQAVAPAGLDGRTVTAIGAGRYHSLALTADGVVTAWGNNAYGQTNVPASLDGKTVTAIAVGFYHALALTSDGQVTAWGDDSDGQTNVPAGLAGKTVTAIYAGPYNSFAVTSDGQVTGWGYNYYGQSNVPASLTGKTVTALAPGLYQTLALTSDGKVTAWGGSPSTGEGVVPASLDGKTVVAVAAGRQDSFALTSDGKVTAWGTNGEGETSPPAGLANVTAISAGESHVIAISRMVQPDGPPVVTGTPRVGSTLTATDGPYNVTPDAVSYQWKAGGTDVGTDSATYAPAPEDAGKTVTVTVTATKAGYTSSSTTSASTAAVANAIFTSGPAATVSGTAEVGQVLTADTTDTTPAATLAGQWLRDGVPVDGATSTSYLLTNADAGAEITYQLTATRDGYDDAGVTSDAVGPVEGGVITPTTPTVTGTPTVGSPLTASATGFDPADATVTYGWERQGTVVGTGSTYTPTADDAGQRLTLVATYTKGHFGTVTSSTVTDAVAPAVFTTAPEADIGGTAKVGQTLTASEGAATPTPDAYTYRWFADGDVIPGAGARTFLLTDAEKNQSITVEVTATKAGYADASALSGPAGPVSTASSPTIDLHVASAHLRRGRSTTLTWTSADATTVTASRGWTGARASHGAWTVRPTRIGTTTYVLTATNDNGTTTAQVSVTVGREARRLHVVAGGGLRLRGHRVTVRSTGLDRSESYAIRIAGMLVATGHATHAGHVDRSVVIPTSTREGRAAVSVTGSETDRTGTGALRVVKNKRLGLNLAQQRVRASDDQRVTVTGLAAGERITVTYQGRRISPRHAHASSHGTWTTSFGVDVYWGAKTVKATGQFAGRTAKATFTVVRRCPDGVHRCR